MELQWMEALKPKIFNESEDLCAFSKQFSENSFENNIGKKIPDEIMIFYKSDLTQFYIM